MASNMVLSAYMRAQKARPPLASLSRLTAALAAAATAHSLSPAASSCGHHSSEAPWPPSAGFTGGSTWGAPHAILATVHCHGRRLHGEDHYNNIAHYADAVGCSLYSVGSTVSTWSAAPAVCKGSGQRMVMETGPERLVRHDVS